MHSYCDVCFMQCGINVTVEDGVAVKIEGNQDHPLSRGRLCPRGMGGLGQLYDPDRLKTPLIRTTVGSRQKFREASWEEALDLIANKTEQMIKEHGAESLALFKHGKGAFAWSKLFYALGSKTGGHTSYAQCRGSRDVGWDLTFGAGPGSPETVALDKAKAVAFIGSHLGENMHNITVQDLSKGLASGAQHIVVDPRFSTLASKAKYWLPIKPGTDTALLLAWTHVLINEGLYDKEYIERYATGFDELKNHVKTFTPEWAAKETEIDAALIVETAKHLGSELGSSLVFPGRRFAWYGDDTQRARAMAIINALLGAWGNDNAFFLGDQFKLPGYKKYPKARTRRAFEYKEKYVLAKSTPTQDLLAASIPGRYEVGDKVFKDPLVKGWYIYSTNLVTSIPNGEALIAEAAKHLDLIVVIETMPAEITGYADVVLPDTTYLERYDVLSNPKWREPFVAIRQPVVDPLYNSKPSWWIAGELAKRLGVPFPYEDFREVIDWQLREVGSSVEEIIKSAGVIKRGYKKPSLKFDTPSGKIELYSKTLEAKGFAPMPEHEPKEEAPKGFYRLLYGRAAQHTFGRTVNNPVLNELYDENAVWVHSQVAKELGLEHNQEVVLRNQDGFKSNPVCLRVTERIRKDCVFTVHGWGRRDRRMKRAYLKGVDDNQLLTKYKEDPIMGGTGSQVNFVRIDAV